MYWFLKFYPPFLIQDFSFFNVEAEEVQYSNIFFFDSKTSSFFSMCWKKLKFFCPQLCETFFPKTKKIEPLSALHLFKFNMEPKLPFNFAEFGRIQNNLMIYCVRFRVQCSHTFKLDAKRDTWFQLRTVLYFSCLKITKRVRTNVSLPDSIAYIPTVCHAQSV